MTLYGLLKRLKSQHKNLDYERSKTPWSIGLGGVRGKIPALCRGNDIEEFETIMRQVFASDFADEYFQEKLNPTISSSDRNDHLVSVIDSFPAKVFSGQVSRHEIDLVKDEMELASKDGSAYRILADIYREFPEFVEQHFPL